GACANRASPGSDRGASPAGRSKTPSGWRSRRTVGSPRRRYQQDRDRHVLLLDPGVDRRSTFFDVDRDHREPLPWQIAVQPLHRRGQLPRAVRSPGGPEVQQYSPPALLGERDRLALEALQTEGGGRLEAGRRHVEFTHERVEVGGGAGADEPGEQQDERRPPNRNTHSGVHVSLHFVEPPAHRHARAAAAAARTSIAVRLRISSDRSSKTSRSGLAALCRASVATFSSWSHSISGPNAWKTRLTKRTRREGSTCSRR